MIERVQVDVLEFALLADLLEYPTVGYVERATKCARLLGASAAAEKVKQFAAAIAELSPERLEEAHVRTFLVAPASAPYVGVHLFGEESFKRAHLMAELIGRFRALDFDPGNELPDHLGVLLRFARVLDHEERDELVRWCLAMPVSAMHRSLAETQNPYRHLYAALLAAVAPEGVPDEVISNIQRVAQTPDQSGCAGCAITPGDDES